MSKKDYILIAEVLKDAKNYMDSMKHWALCRNFGERLAETNTKFDLARFLEACGLDVK